MGLHAPDRLMMAPELAEPRLKPAGPVEIDYANPMSDRIRDFIMLGENVNLAQPETLVWMYLNGGHYYETRPHYGMMSVYHKLTGSSTSGIEISHNWCISGSYTHMFHFVQGPDTTYIRIFSDVYLTSGQRINIGVINGNYNLVSNTHVHTPDQETGPVGEFQTPHDTPACFVISYDENSGVTYAAMNGEVKSGIISNGPPDLFVNERIFSNFSHNLDGAVWSYASWNRSMPHGEVASLSADPYQILKPLGSI